MLPRLPEFNMATSCSPSDLIEGAKCYSTCLLNEELSAIELWLLTQIAGTTDDVQTLLNNSRCLENCVEHGNAEAVIVWLLTQIAGVNSDPNSLMSAARCIEACIIPEESKAIDVSLEVQIAESTADLGTLLNNARCFRLCAADWRGTAIKIYLLAIEAGVSTDPATLIGSANCLLGCLNHDQLKLIETYLWCQVANLAPEPPVITPESFTGLAHWWRADDLSGVVADGQPVGDVGKEWVDRIAGLKGEQPVAAQRPSFVAAWTNGKPAVKCHTDATAAKFLTLDGSFILPATPGEYTCAFAVSLAIIAGNPNFDARMFARIANQPRAGSRKNAANYHAALVVDAGLSANFPAFTGANLWVPPHVIYITRATDGSTAALYNNSDKQLGSGLNGSSFINSLIMGTGFGENVDVNYAEALHYSRVLTDPELASLYDDYFKPRYALP